MPPLDEDDAWCVGHWGRVVGDQAAIMEEVIRRVREMAHVETFDDQVVLTEVHSHCRRYRYSSRPS